MEKHLTDFMNIPVSRREALKYGAKGIAALCLWDLISFNLLGTEALAANAAAKTVIQIWLSGGPSHIDTFDPKPDAGRDYCGPYNKPLSTNVDGIRICQMLPQLAKIADKYTLLRGMTHGNNGHETAAYMMLTGRKGGGTLVYPGIGSVVSCMKGYERGYTGKLPPYITLTAPLGRFSECGFLSSKYKSFITGGDPSRPVFGVEGIISENISDERQQQRRVLLGNLDRLSKEMPSDPMVKSLEECREQAYSIIMGEAGKAFVLTDEKPELRDRYGRSKFGQSCLVARRLTEHGVRFITIHYPGWDHHKQIFEDLNRKLPEFDKGIASLLEDLSDHGLLDSTIVWVAGEFGRTPKIDWDAPWNGGRGHYGKAFSSLIAGGGLKGGQVIGKTDERGETVIERPVYPWDLAASIYRQMGIDENEKLPEAQGRTVLVSPFASGDIKEKETGGILKELMT